MTEINPVYRAASADEIATQAYFAFGALEPMQRKRLSDRSRYIEKGSALDRVEYFPTTAYDALITVIGRFRQIDADVFAEALELAKSKILDYKEIINSREELAAKLEL